ncbi:MAG: 4-hydroxythreonine-4-phosphate dehydrogenase PdxA, partial [Acidobacteriota bacterium]
MPRPIIAITMGDAAGVGPEVIMKSLAHAEVHQHCCPLVVGDAQRLRRAGEISGVGLAVQSVPASGLGQAQFRPGIVDCIDLGIIPADLPWGKVAREAGEGSYRFLEAAA